MQSKFSTLQACTMMCWEHNAEEDGKTIKSNMEVLYYIPTFRKSEKVRKTNFRLLFFDVFRFICLPNVSFTYLLTSFYSKIERKMNKWFILTSFFHLFPTFTDSDASHIHNIRSLFYLSKLGIEKKVSLHPQLRLSGIFLH